MVGLLCVVLVLIVGLLGRGRFRSPVIPLNVLLGVLLTALFSCAKLLGLLMCRNR